MSVVPSGRTLIMCVSGSGEGVTEVTPLTSRIFVQQVSSQKTCEGDLYANRCRPRKLRKTHAKRNGSKTAKVVGENCSSSGSSGTRIPERAHRRFVGNPRLYCPNRTAYSGRDRTACARPCAGCILLEDGPGADYDSLSPFRGHLIVAHRDESGSRSHVADHPRGLRPQNRSDRLRS